MPMLMMSCSSFSYSNIRGVTAVPAGEDTPVAVAPADEDPVAPVAPSQVAGSC
jgi:hypothetical protein